MARAIESRMRFSKMIRWVLPCTCGILLAGCASRSPESQGRVVVQDDSRSEESAKQSVQVLLRIFNEQNADFTPAMYDLREIGLPALQLGSLELLLSDHALTRKRAQRLVEGIAARQMGYRPAKGWPTQKAGEQYQMLVRAIDYQWEAHPKQREEAYKRWKEWVGQQSTTLKQDWGYDR